MALFIIYLLFIYLKVILNYVHYLSFLFIDAIGLNAIFASNINPFVLNGSIFSCISNFPQAFR